jgi:hypothetical protein
MDETKQEILDDIASMLRLPRWRVSTGSTEPREALVDIANALSVPVSRRSSKPEIAAAIAHAGGQSWDASCDSADTPSGGGGTITHEGLRRVRSAVQQHLVNH